MNTFKLPYGFEIPFLSFFFFSWRVKDVGKHPSISQALVLQMTLKG